MKPIFQSEAAECGLAALATVASAHGLHLTLPALRRRFSTSLRGASLNQLADIARELGFEARGLRAEPEVLGDLALPCVLHWDFNHFVVLIKADRSRFVIFDPARGERRLTLPEVSRHFTGVALELTPTTTFQKTVAPERIRLRDLIGNVVGLKRSGAQILVLSLALQLLAVLAPFYLQWVVDKAIVSADHRLLLVLSTGFLLLLLFQIVVSALRGWSVIYLSSSLSLQWTNAVFSHLLKLPLAYFEKRNLGDVTSRLGSVQAIQRTLTTNFVEAFIDGLMAATTLCVMVAYSAKLTMISVTAVAAYVGVRKVAFARLRDQSEDKLVVSAKQQTYLLESLRGIQSLKVAGGEGRRSGTYANLTLDATNSDVRLQHLALGFASANQVIFGVERIVVVAIGAQLALENVFTVGMLMAYLAYKELYAQRAAGLVDKWMEFKMLNLHGERLADVVLSPVQDSTELVDLPADFCARIEVTDLWFRYADSDPWVIQGATFVVEPGEAVAFVGASGCGKTTLVKLMLGLLTPDRGTVRIGGVEAHRLSPRSRRDYLGAVMQDDQLFAGTTGANIAFFDDVYHSESVESAAALAAIHDEIKALPMAYESLIGDMGSSLSGGQKQRVILARALYRTPRILFLDEATSHLDVTNEALVNKAIIGMNLTRVVVAHRPETIACADRVLVVQAGQVRDPRHASAEHVRPAPFLRPDEVGA